MNEDELNYTPSETAGLDLDSLSEEALPEGHRSGVVAVVGRPNVGKSTLMNALLRQKVAIVSPRPQTTRTRQLGIITEPDYQVIFVDTPGLVNPRHRLDEYMVSVADESLRDADIILWLVDASEQPGAGDEAIAAALHSLPKDTKMIVGINKADLVQPEDVLARTEAYRALLTGAPWLFFSARQGDGLERLLEMIVEALPEGPRYYPADQTTDSFVRDIAAELIREQIFLQMRDELPYGTAVRLDTYQVSDHGLTRIKATIFVERQSHKKMIIGAGGLQLREIGAAARKEIERLIEGKVYLELWVKVQPRWRRDSEALKRLGYS